MKSPCVLQDIVPFGAAALLTITYSRKHTKQGNRCRWPHIDLGRLVLFTIVKYKSTYKIAEPTLWNKIQLQKLVSPDKLALISFFILISGYNVDNLSFDIEWLLKHVAVIVNDISMIPWFVRPRRFLKSIVRDIYDNNQSWFVNLL